ncbi:ROK family protein, partial [Thioclava sp. BHET1]
FVAEALPELRSVLPPAVRDRIAGLGIALPFQLWNWAQFIAAPTQEMDAWRHRDIQDELAALTRMPVYLQNDATAACGAELVFGTGPRPRDFLYFYVAYFIGGGIALNGQLYTGRSGNAGALGSMPVPAPGGGLRQLISVASLASLESYLQAEGVTADRLWETPPGWSAPEPILARWVEEAATGIAHAILGATALLDIDTALIDGWMPDPVRARLVAATATRLSQADRTGIELPQIHPGSIGSRARQLGAASIPLSQRYLVDQNALLTLG